MRQLHFNWLILACVLRLSAADPSAFADEGEDESFEKSRIQRNRALFFADKPKETVEGYQSHLARLVQKKIESLDRTCNLSDVQKKHLELAGQGAIRQLFTQIDSQIQTLQWEKRKINNGTVIFLMHDPDMGRLRSQLRAGPFDGDSFYGKAVQKILTEEQQRLYQDLPRRAAISNKVIQAENATELVRIYRHQGNIGKFDWDQQGRRVALLYFDQRIELFDASMTTKLAVVAEDKKPVDFDFSPDGNLLAIGGNSDQAFILDLVTGNEIRLETGQSQPSVRFSPDGKMLATGGYGKAVKLWNPAVGTLIKELEAGPTDGGLRPVFSPDGTLLAIGHRNSQTRIYAIPSGELLPVLTKAMSQGLNFDPSGRILAIAYVDGNLTLWDPATGKQLRSAKAWASELYTANWSKDGRLLVTAGNQSQVTIWNADDLSILAEIESPEWVIDCRFSPDGTRLFFSGGNGIDQSGRAIEVWAVP